MPVHLVREAIRHGVLPAPTGPLDAGTVDELFSLLAAQAEANGPARDILREAARAASDAIVTVLNLLDADTVVFGGPFWSRVSDVFLAEIPRLLAKDPALLRVHPVTVTASSIGEDVAAVGAACLVLDNALSPRPSALLIST
jgi:predicted NBD/HSP70 family sugar kinase